MDVDGSGDGEAVGVDGHADVGGGPVPRSVGEPPPLFPGTIGTSPLLRMPLHRRREPERRDGGVLDVAMVTMVTPSPAEPRPDAPSMSRHDASLTSKMRIAKPTALALSETDLQPLLVVGLRRARNIEARPKDCGAGEGGVDTGQRRVPSLPEREAVAGAGAGTGAGASHAAAAAAAVTDSCFDRDRAVD
eukprot:TRINITY_DN8647_c0_g2_i1.p3 TRINITY_DN8647_c0_g2~~TRINITY_DN8647_c0_g2_i1.p3  ORF type:complete len:190 (+),score=36.52 TRINITY_DN8647_c0_g2_i1:711-1280(+)